MTTYRIDPIAHAAFISRFIRRQIAVKIVLALIAAPVMYFATGPSHAIAAISIGLLVVVFTIVSALSVRNVRRGANRYVETYALRIEGDALFCSGELLAPMTIARMQVTRVAEDARAGLTVQGRDRFQVVFVPRSLSGYEDVRAILLTWKELSATNSNPLYVSIAATVVGIIAWAGTGILPLRFAMLAGIVMLALMGLYFRELYKAPVEASIKRKIVPGMVMFAIAPFARLLLNLVLPEYEELIRQMWNFS